RASAAHRSSHTDWKGLSLPSLSGLKAIVSAQDFTRVWVDTPRWLLLATLVFAPWAYGSTQPWAIQTLKVLLGLVGVLWLAECLARRRCPRVPIVLALFTGLLLLQGWGMAVNAHHYLDPQSGGLLPKTAWLPSAPGAADSALSLSTMQLLTGLLAALLL